MSKPANPRFRLLDFQRLSTSMVWSWALISAAFILCAALGMLLAPAAFHKFFFEPAAQIQKVPYGYYWDEGQYADMMLQNLCTAFYPLWVELNKWLFHPQTRNQAVRVLLTTATVLHFAQIPFLLWVFQKSLNRKYLAFLLVLVYCISPLAIFRVNGYTESLFSALSLGLIWALIPEPTVKPSLKLAVLGVATFLLSLTRPISLQVIAAAIATLLTLIFFLGLPAQPQQFSWKTWLKLPASQLSSPISTSLVLCSSTVLGYSVYGSFCYRVRGDFFAPFKDQLIWQKSLGFRPNYLLLPSSPLVDLLALYLPILIVAAGFLLTYCKLKHQSLSVCIPKSPWWMILLFYPPLLIGFYVLNLIRWKLSKADKPQKLPAFEPTDYTETLAKNYLFWFSAYFVTIHSVLVFLTQQRSLMSLGRYVFAIPFVFLAMGYLCRCLPTKKTYTLLWGLVAISALLLVQQWMNYGGDRWIG